MYKRKSEPGRSAKNGLKLDMGIMRESITKGLGSSSLGEEDHGRALVSTAAGHRAAEMYTSYADGHREAHEETYG